MRITWDLEGNSLLNDDSVDYTSSPYKLKDSFKMHCIVLEDHSTGDIYAFYDGPKYLLDGRPYKEWDKDLKCYYTLSNYKPKEYTKFGMDYFPQFLKDYKVESAVSHNGINYDHLVCKLFFQGMDYDVAYQGTPGNWGGQEMEIIDTLVMSKTLNPDRYGGHSLDALSKLAGVRKVDFRPHIKDGSDKFKTFAADMLYYCIYDVLSLTSVYNMLEKEKSKWDKWEDALELEHNTAYVITGQEHRGFRFDIALAEKNIRELDNLMAECKKKADPYLPMKVPTKTFLASVTPPKRQFLKTGKPSSYLEKFADKHGGSIQGQYPDYTMTVFGKTYQLPLPDQPLVTSVKAELDDSVAIKEWLVSLGWRPSEYKEKELTMKSGSKRDKRSPEDLAKTIDDYVEQTLNSNFCADRCALLDVSPEGLKAKLNAHKNNRPLKVPTNPNYTVGQDKEECPMLEEVREKFPHAREAIDYLTYKHRRNSILGGGMSWEDRNKADKGYIPKVRADGRIGTPADTQGAGSTRFTHRDVSNIPRTTSLYGEPMRALFGVQRGMYQIGYDFDSLEAKVEAHFCHPWDYTGDTTETKQYVQSLIQEKPNDCHTILSKKITALLGRTFERGPSKNVKYGCLPVDNTEILTDKGWVSFGDFSNNTHRVVGYNKDLNRTQMCEATKEWFYKDADVIITGAGDWVIESTENHRWYGYLENLRGKKGPIVTETLNLGGDFSVLVLSDYLKVEGEGSVHQDIQDSLCKGHVKKPTRYFSRIESRKTDVFCLTTELDSFVIRQNGIITITGNCSYNAQPPRIARTVGCSIKDAKVIFDAFWDQAISLKVLKEKMIRWWEKQGDKKFLLGIDGRKLSIRSKGNVINSAFQSTGVICAKRAMVIHYRRLKITGKICDFFKDDWKNSSFCQQMIAYHK